MTTTAAKSIISDIEKRTAAGPHTGDIVWWSLEGAVIDGKAFRADWKGSGLPADLLPEDPAFARILKRAVRAARAAVDKDREDAAQSILLRPVKRTAADDGSGTLVVYALVREARGAGDKDGITEANRYEQLAQLAVNNATGQFLSDKPQDPVVLAVKDIYDGAIGQFNGNEVRSAITRAMRRFGGILIRETGGVYWVPSKYAVQVRAVAEVVGRIGTCSFEVLPTHDTVEGTRTLSKAAESSLSAQLGDLAHEMEEWKSGARKARKGTLTDRLKEYEELDARARLYADVLSLKSEKLVSDLKELAAEAQRILDAKDAEEDDAEEGEDDADTSGLKEVE